MTGTIAVWDIAVRVGHWLLVAMFFAAYLTDDDYLTIHTWAGYGVGLYVVARVLWGIVGTRHARFSDSFYGPQTAWRHLIDLVLFRAKRHVGHSPAGAWMVFALLVVLAAATVSGVALLGMKENAGPLAPWLGQATTPLDPARAAEQQRERRAVRRARIHPLEGVHEFFASLTLTLVIAHVAGVLLASLAHRENLIRSMIDGHKRAE